MITSSGAYGRSGVPISEIGVVAAGEGEARFVGMDGEPLVFARTSFSHF